MYVHTYMYVHNTYMYLVRCMYVYMNVCMNLCMRVCMNVYVHLNGHI